MASLPIQRTGRIANDLILHDVSPTGEEIGRGAYGRVFEVDYQGTLCAAKEIHALLLEISQHEALHKIKSDFLRECRIWSTIRHPCVVQFLGTLYHSFSVCCIIDTIDSVVYDTSLDDLWLYLL